MAFINRLPGGGGSEGTATAADVLTGKTFSNDNDAGLVGTMPNMGSTTTTVATINDATTGRGDKIVNMFAVENDNSIQTTFTPPKGYYDGVNSKVNLRLWGVSPAMVKAGAAIGSATNQWLTGTFTSDANATAGQILSGVTAYVNGSKVTGTMPNHGSINLLTDSVLVQDSNVYFNIQNAGYYVAGSDVYTTQSNLASKIGLTAAKIMSGNTVLGVAGTGTADANATASQLLSGASAYVKGVKVTGTMVSRGMYTDPQSVAVDANTTWVRIHQGAYITNSTTGYPEITVSNASLAGAAGITANKIVAGNTILGVTGTGGSKRYIKKTNVATDSFSGLTYHPNCGVSTGLNGFSESKTKVCPSFSWTNLTGGWKPSVVKVTHRANGSSSNYTYVTTVSLGQKRLIWENPNNTSTYYICFITEAEVTGMSNALTFIMDYGVFLGTSFFLGDTAVTHTYDVECWE